MRTCRRKVAAERQQSNRIGVKRAGQDLGCQRECLGRVGAVPSVEALLKPEYAILEGAITGRALYDGRIDAHEALALLAKVRKPVA